MADRDDGTDPTDGPDTAELERGGAVANNDDAELLAKLDKMDEDRAAGERAKKKDRDDRREKKKAAAPKDDEAAKAKAKQKAADESRERSKAKDDDDQADDDKAKDDEAEDDNDEPDAADEATDDDDERPPATPPKKDGEERIPSKNLNAILRTKQRAMADVDNARTEVIRQARQLEQDQAAARAKWEPIEQAQKQLDMLGSRVKSSPRAGVQLLKRLGTTNWDEVANYAIAQSEKYSNDPKMEALRRQYTLDDGGATTEVEELRRKQHELEQRLSTQEQERAAAAKRQVEESRELQYVDNVIAEASDEHAFVKAGLKNKPTLVKAALRALIQELYQQTSVVPSHAKVLAEFERRRSEDAAAYGLPLPKNKPKAGENEAASDLATQSRARAAQDDDEDDDDEDEEARTARIRRKLDAMDEEARLKSKKQRRK
jgi:hypothetical protein